MHSSKSPIKQRSPQTWAVGLSAMRCHLCIFHFVLTDCYFSCWVLCPNGQLSCKLEFHELEIKTSSSSASLVVLQNRRIQELLQDSSSLSLQRLLRRKLKEELGIRIPYGVPRRIAYAGAGGTRSLHIFFLIWRLQVTSCNMFNDQVQPPASQASFCDLGVSAQVDVWHQSTDNCSQCFLTINLCSAHHKNAAQLIFSKCTSAIRLYAMSVH